MAPRKTMMVEPSTRVTRSSTRLTKVNTESPKKKKATKSPSEKKLEANKPKIEAKAEAEGEGEAAPAAADAKVEIGGLKGKTIIIEHCKQCNSFKTRALQVKSGLEKVLEGSVDVILNPEKPRRGCFEIREEGEGGEKFISLLDMKRPFTPMKALDMEQVMAEIIEKIK